MWGQRRTRDFHSWTERKASFRHGMGTTEGRVASRRDSGEGVGSQKAQDEWRGWASSGGSWNAEPSLGPSWGAAGLGNGLRAGRTDGQVRRFYSLNSHSGLEEEGFFCSLTFWTETR